jgi:hypothetical protein
MPKPEILDKLPIHQSDRTESTPHKLRVDGFVGQPLELSIQDLQAMPQTDFTEEFSCLEGWTVPDVNWKGVTLESVLALAEPKSEARWVQASAAAPVVFLQLMFMTDGLVANTAVRRTASRILRVVGSTPRNAAAPPSVTVSLSYLQIRVGTFIRRHAAICPICSGVLAAATHSFKILFVTQAPQARAKAANAHSE